MDKIIFFATVLFMPVLSLAQETSLLKLNSDKKQSAITYSMHHPLHSWTGESKDMSSVITTDKTKMIISKVTVSVKVATFDSDNGSRDSHMRESTEALIYPNITFESDSIRQNGNKLSVTGILNFHGVRQKISFAAEKNMSQNAIQVTGSFSVSMAQYKIKAPALLGMDTDDEIKLSFKMVYQ